MKVKIKILSEQAVLPFKASEGASRYDVTCFDGQHDLKRNIITYRTGIAVEVPKGYEIELVPRSSTCHKWGISLANQQGVIDHDYRGEIFVKFRPEVPEYNPWKYIKQERLVQMKLTKASNIIDWIEVDELSETERGDGGFGSTG